MRPVVVWYATPMGAWGAWLEANWFNLVQSAGIVAGSVVAIVMLRLERRSRHLGDYLTLVQQHRELWSEVHRRHELARVLQADADLIGAPITPAEREFLNLAIDHFHTGWLLACHGVVLRLEVLRADAREFFRLPLAQRVWEMTKGFRSPAFVDFVEDAIRMPPP